MTEEKCDCGKRILTGELCEYCRESLAEYQYEVWKEEQAVMDMMDIPGAKR